MSIASKLQLKGGGTVRVVNQPDGVALDVPTTTAEPSAAVIVFVKNKSELAQHEAQLIEAARADRLAWIAYPKAGQLDTDLNRDILWKLLEGRGVRPVRQVAIDEVWSALRFRPA